MRQALAILTPAMPGRMEDGNTMLTHWTKKIIVEDSHTVAQLTHMLQLIVGHYKVSTQRCRLVELMTYHSFDFYAQILKRRYRYG